MNINSYVESNIQLVELEGTVDSSCVPEFSAFLIRTIQESDRPVVLDLSKTVYMGSSGLRVITMAQKQAFAKGLSFGLCSPSKELWQLLLVVHIERCMMIYDSKEEAFEKMTKVKSGL